jgi:ribA/ribD-fused uncharacterized protein
MKQKLLKIFKFDGPNRYLSNFHPAPFVWKGREWKTAEHAYQAMKSTQENEKEFIRKLETAREAKIEGKKVTLRSDWDSIKDSIMEEIVYEKFSQNADLAKQLIETGDAIIEEGNTWGDKYWGICPPDSGVGENKLGFILMKIRKKLKG